ncbi:hypothetical protein WAX74_13540 [Psychrobacillus sp. FJAT-51614]|uniref:Group-specific protein n=1 Tax=Psychrobacillus mangrovi TaxID=3117745 RepID=A0ABU8F6L5_9BACI
MVEEIKIQNLTITKAYMTYLFPFSFLEKERVKFIENIENHQFNFFKLDNNKLQDLYYGKGIKVSHKELDQYFLPYIEDKLFPFSTNERGFLRYSKEIRDSYVYEVNGNKLDFIINSIDIILCPYGIGLITIRTEMDKQQVSLTNVLDFMSHFRVLEAKIEEEKGGKIIHENGTYNSTSELILDYLCHNLKPFIIRNKKLEGYYGSLPYFEDERMFASAFFIADENQTITNDQLFRMGQLDGRDSTGQDFISANNLKYIERYIEKRLYDRWAPSTYIITSEHTQTTISMKRNHELENEISHFMGIHYYNLWLHYYYKIMLLKLSFEHSEVSWSKDKEYVEELIEQISKFDSRYYFKHVSVRMEGKELTNILKETFSINTLFEEVKNTVDDLNQAQEKQRDKRQNMLLFMLTVFTVISGIYGMNLIIEDWKGKTDWSKVSGYSFFEWISLLTALIGISLSILLLAWEGIKGIRNIYRKRKRNSFK